MRDFVILFLHLIVTLMRLARPGGIRSVVAESVLIKHQVLILNRSRLSTNPLHPPWTSFRGPHGATAAAAFHWVRRVRLKPPGCCARGVLVRMALNWQ